MKQFIPAFFLATLFACSSKGDALDTIKEVKDSAKTETPVTPGATAGTYQLVWQDEFNVNGDPDPTKWVFTGRSTPYWQQYCTDRPEVRYVKDGYLYLKGIKNIDMPSDTASHQTGCICTLGKFSFLYGKIQVRAKLEKTGKGAWPAIWMMPEKIIYGPWPKSGEIDIMERINTQQFVHQTLHTWYTKHGGANNPINTQKTVFPQPDFNVFGLEWTPDSLLFSMNDSVTLRYPRSANSTFENWPFDQKFYVILNQAAGGNWPGAVNPADLPFSMAVDWVRVYQKQ